MDDRVAQYRDLLKQAHLDAWAGRLAAAEDAYRRAAELAPERSAPLVGLAAVLVRLERHADAAVALKTALRRDPSDEAARARLAELGRRSIPKASEAAGSAPAEGSAPANRPPRPEPAAWPAADLDQARAAPSARPAASAAWPAADAMPGSSGRPAVLERVDALAIDRLADEAERALGGPTAPGADRLTLAAACYARLGRTEAAVDLAREAVALDASHLGAQELLLDLLVRAGHREAAAEKARLLARLYEASGRPADAARIRRSSPAAPEPADPSAIIGPDVAGPPD